MFCGETDTSDEGAFVAAFDALIAALIDAQNQSKCAPPMDDLAEQIEAAVDADPYLGGKAGDTILERTEMEIREGGTTS